MKGRLYIMLFNRNGASVDNEVVSDEAIAYITEAMIADLDSESISMFLENTSEVDAAMGENIVLERTIVRLDKAAKLSKARKMAIFTVAKEKKDKDFEKLLTVWKMERYLEAKLAKKYGNEAMRRAKKTVAAAAKSKSNIVKKAAAKAKAAFNPTQVKVPPKPQAPKGINVK